MSRSCEQFRFRDLHPYLFLGTASDRYAGWVGQVYSADRYGPRIQRRSRKIGKRTYLEERLPVESVVEYFLHFPVLEIDFTFYGFLWEEGPTGIYRMLQSYAGHLKEGDGLILKVPQAVFARKVWREGRFTANLHYLDAEAFVKRFYRPACRLLGAHLKGLIFEQEYHRREERESPREVAARLRSFFRAIPRDGRYHVELRTPAYLVPEVFTPLERLGIGRVLSHWTWLPSLREQLRRAGGGFLDRTGDSVIRLMTPRNVRYEEAYERAWPFDSLVSSMVDPRMIEDTVAIMRARARAGNPLYVIVNNRAGGNAPLLARILAERCGAVAGATGDGAEQGG